MHLVCSTYRYDFHRGVDIPIPEGTPLYAIDDGVVRISGNHSGYSNRIVQVCTVASPNPGLPGHILFVPCMVID